MPDYRWLDWGRDYYAAVSFSNAPDGRRLMIGWMNNWQYANHFPTSPWRSPMSLVRDVSLVSVNGQPRLVQQPAPEVRIPSQPGPVRRVTVDGPAPVEGGAAVQLVDITFTPGSAEEFGLVIRGQPTARSGHGSGSAPAAENS